MFSEYFILGNVYVDVVLVRPPVDLQQAMLHPRSAKLPSVTLLQKNEVSVSELCCGQ